MQWKILQNKKPQDYVIATGKSYTVKEFVNLCCNYLKLRFLGKVVVLILKLT